MLSLSILFLLPCLSPNIMDSYSSGTVTFSSASVFSSWCLIAATEKQWIDSLWFDQRKGQYSLTHPYFSYLITLLLEPNYLTSTIWFITWTISSKDLQPWPFQSAISHFAWPKWQTIFSAVLKILRIAKENPQDLQSVSPITHSQPGRLGRQCYTIILIAPFRLPSHLNSSTSCVSWRHHQISLSLFDKTLALFPISFSPHLPHWR